MANEPKHELAFRNSAEQNRKVIESKLWKSSETGEDETPQDLRESMKRVFPEDIASKEFLEKITAPNFSWRQLKKQLREADSSSSFTQVLRAGIQSIVNGIYKTVPVTYTEWAHVVSSSLFEELYAPLHGIGFPAEVGEQTVYPEVAAAGLDIKLRNRKFGSMWPVSKRLIDFDQTGQFVSQVGLMAQYAAQVWEVYCYGKLASVSGMKYSNLTVPTTETKPATESVYPWSTALVGGGVTKPSSPLALSQANIQTGFIALMNQLNLLGLKMNVQPDTIAISPHYNFDLKTLLHSAYYPTVVSATNLGNVGAINPIEGIAKPVVSRFMFDQNGSVSADSKAWYLMDSKVPWFIAQIFEASTVEQEATNAGESFNRDVIRHKLRIQGNADFIDPRFAWQGSDGSV